MNENEKIIGQSSDEQTTDAPQVQYRYIKRIIFYAILSVGCLICGFIKMGIFLLAITACYALLSYKQRFKYATSGEELAFKLWKKHRKGKFSERKESKRQYKERLDEIEKEFDFDYGDRVEYICEDCGNRTKMVYKKGAKRECPVCSGKLIPAKAEAIPEQNNSLEDDGI